MPTEKEKKEIIRRFRILAGQVEGINKMITENKDCVDIIYQIKAVKSGFNKLGETFIKRYLKECGLKGKSVDLSEKEFDKVLGLLSNY